jgi:two-component sensor histidine kinase
MTKEAGWVTGPDYGSLAYFYIEHKEFAKARPYLLTAISLNDKMTTVYEKRQQQYELFLVDSAARNYTAAIRDLNENHALNDSIESSKRRADVEKIMIQFETEKKEAEIKNFKQKELLNRAQQARQDVIRNVVIGAAACFLIAAAIFYRQYRSKKALSDVISQKNRKQEALLSQLNRALNEKEWLLKEVHHRVKNNLHTVMCLLESQALHLESDALRAIDDSKHRIYAMSLIHQRLYETEDMKSIDLQSYIGEFVGYLKDSFSLGPRVHFELDIEPMQISVPVAIPLALIINEAVTNSIKHAFHGIDRPNIYISLHSNQEILHLTIADNGTGIKDLDKFTQAGSLGMKLIRGLTEDLSGKLTIESDKGTKISIDCSINPFGEEVDINEAASVAIT